MGSSRQDLVGDSLMHFCLRLSGIHKGSTLRLVGSGLKFCKEDLNMAAINFSPLQNLKWL